MSAIVVEDLVKRYGGFTAVEDVSFTAAPGEVTALLGPNGAGKTTTIEILEGFQAPTAGTIRVLGTDPRAGGRAGQSWRARIGLVLQSTSLDAQLTVTEALTLFGGLYPGRRRAGEVLDVIDMAADAQTRIGALSGGQRRRVDLGIAIIGQPEMLFLDEPTTGLDPEARRRLWSVIENLTASGTGVLLTTHYLDEAQRLASRVVVLADGRVVADASPDKLRAMGGVPVIRYRLPRGRAGPARGAGRPRGRRRADAALGRRDGGPGPADRLGPREPRGPDRPGGRVAQPGGRLPGPHQRGRSTEPWLATGLWSRARCAIS